MLFRSKVLDNGDIPVNPKDKVTPDLDSKLADNDTIVIKRAVNVNVLADGEEHDIQSAEEDILSMLEAEEIPLGVEDKISPDGKSQLYEGMEVCITRVETKFVTEAVPISYNEVIKKDSKMANTKKQTTQEGIDGEKEVTTRIVYEDGIEV